jgi:hypothetical protein
VKYCWKDFNKGYNFASNFILIGGLQIKLWAPKVMEISTLGIFRLTFVSPRKKCHLGAGLVAMHKVYYKGEGGGFPQAGLW